MAALILLTGLLLLSGCAGGREKGMKPSPDWSRGVQQGSSVNGSAGVVVEGQGEKIHMVWLYSESGESAIRYVQLDQAGREAVDRAIQLPPGQLRMPRLLPGGDGLLHLLWANRETSREKWSLWHTLLNQEGSPVIPAQQISLPGVNVREYTAVSLPGQQAAVIWSSSPDTSLYGLNISPKGEPDAEQTLITENGNSPGAQVDAQGDLHLTWVADSRFYYHRYPGAQLAPAAGTAVAEEHLNTGESISGPVLGLTDGWAYIIWGVQRQSGLDAGTARTGYISFPLEEPHFSNAQLLWLLPVEEQPYQPHQGAYNITLLAAPVSSNLGTDFVYQPAVVNGQRSELAVAVAMRQDYRQDNHVQIAVLLFEEGQFKGYEVASKTQALSSDPVLVADEANALHLIWRQGAMGRDIYYATTAPAARDELDRLTGGDVANALFTGGMESFAGILFFPWIGFGWLLPGVLVLGIHKAIKDYDSVARSKTALVLLILAVLIYQGVKLISLPSITFYVPFSAWIEVPRTWETPLLVSVPLVILAIAALVTVWVRRKRSDSALVLYFAFAVADALLSLAIYGVGYLGVY
jgi:hypothetical protein